LGPGQRGGALILAAHAHAAGARRSAEVSGRHISPNRIAEIVGNRRRITADTPLRLSLHFGGSPEFWPNLQTHYDLKIAPRQLSAEAAERIRAHRAG
jgi:antitoxin HigA-1